MAFSETHWHLGSPSFVAGGVGVEPMKMVHTMIELAFRIVAVHPSAVRRMTGNELPVVTANCNPPGPMRDAYLTESAKKASSAVTRFRRSDFILDMYTSSRVSCGARVIGAPALLVNGLPSA